MVKTIFIVLDDEEHEKLTAIKDRRDMTWKEMLLKAGALLK